MLGVIDELGKEAGNVCLRRDRRAPQAFSGGSHRFGWRGAGEPERAERERDDPGRDRRLAAGDARGDRGRGRLGVVAGAAGGLRVRPSPGAPAAWKADGAGQVTDPKGPGPDPGT